MPFEAHIDDGEGGKLIGLTFRRDAGHRGFARVQYAALTALDDARLVWVSLGQLLGGRVGVNDLAGPVGVASTMAVTARVNIRAFLQLVAFISINLGVMNLLPLPALDGGRLVFLIIEGIRASPCRRSTRPCARGRSHAAAAHAHGLRHGTRHPAPADRQNDAVKINSRGCRETILRPVFASKEG